MLETDPQQEEQLSHYLLTLDGFQCLVPILGPGQDGTSDKAVPVAIMAPAPKNGLPSATFPFKSDEWVQYMGRGTDCAAASMPLFANLVPINSIDDHPNNSRFNVIGIVKKSRALQQGPSQKYWLVKLEDSYNNPLSCWIFPKGMRLEVGAALPNIKKDQVIVLFNVTPFDRGITIGNKTDVFVAQDPNRVRATVVAANA